MANWSDLKAAVASIVKTNGNKEITGQLLQNVLNNIISNVGENATFVSIATPSTNPGAPDGKVFYLAIENGLYSNFGGIELRDEVVILKNNNSGSWEKVKTGIPSAAELRLLKNSFTYCPYIDVYIDTEEKTIEIKPNLRIYAYLDSKTLAAGASVLHNQGKKMSYAEYADNLQVYPSVYILVKNTDSIDTAAILVGVRAGDSDKVLQNALYDGYCILGILRPSTTENIPYSFVIDAPHYYYNGEKIYNKIGQSVLDKYTPLSKYMNRSVLEKSIMSYRSDGPCYIIDFISNTIKVGRGLKLYSVDGTITQTVTTSENVLWDKVIQLPDTTSYWYHMLIKGGYDIVCVTTANDLQAKIDEGYYYILTARRTAGKKDAYVKGNVNWYSVNGVDVNKDMPKDLLDDYFNDFFYKHFPRVTNPLYSSKFIEKIEKHPAGSVGTYRNGIFEITSIQYYAGLNFYIDGKDDYAYYIINIKSEKYKSFSESSENRITHGARKYDKDANTPSGLIISQITTNTESDGSLTLGVKIENPEHYEDTVYRLMFWGEVDTIGISAIKVYDEWEFKECVKGNFGIVSKTSLSSKNAENAEKAKKADVAFEGKYFNENTAGKRMSITYIQELSLSDNGEYSGVYDNVANDNKLSILGTFEDATNYFAVAILNNTDLPDDMYLRCTVFGNANYSKEVYSNKKEIDGKTIILTVTTPIAWNGVTKKPDSVYFRTGSSQFTINCESIMGFSSTTTDYDKLFNYICENIDTIKLNVDILSFGTTLHADTAKKAYTAFDGDKYEEYKYAANIGSVTSLGSYTTNARGENELYAVIENVRGYGNTFMTVSLPKEYPYYIGVAVLGNGYDPNNAPAMRLTGGNANNVNTHLDKTIAVKDKYVRIQIVSAREYNGALAYPSRFYFYGAENKYFKFNIFDMKTWAIDGITEADFYNIEKAIATSVKTDRPLVSSDFALGKLTADEVENIEPIVEQVKNGLNVQTIPGIVCWGSSSTAGGGWVSKLSTLTGLKTFNGGIGGENLWTILGRIGSEPIRLNSSITIPSTTTPIQLGSGTGASSSILYVRGKKITPLLQGNGLLNPVIIDGIEGTLTWTGSSYNDSNGYYTFTRSQEGEEKTTLPDEIVFSYGSREMRNCIQILLLGYNGGYSTTEEYVSMVKRAKEFSLNGMCLIVGRHAAATKDAADKIIEEEKAFKQEFGMMFVSSREYMVHRGLQEAGIEPTEQDILDISNGIVPTSLRADTAHFNSYGYNIYLNLIHRRLNELGYVNSL